MLRYATLLSTIVIIGATVACESARRSSVGFRLADDGDVERGRATFVALGCPSCHTVVGMELAPAGAARAQAPIPLGGEVHKTITDGYLTTSIINPSYRLAPHHPKEQVATDGKSRMPSYADRMTVRQLTDLVAFLQSRYVVRLTTPKYAY
jgi:sulfur-oxidizing protein SoxX